MHDDTQVARVVEMGMALRNGQFPVRWVNDLGYGYGYPIFNFYGPLPYYFGGLLYALGVTSVIATKIMFGVGIIGPAITLFSFLLPVIGWQAALAASVLVLYAPYHAVQIYVRGAVGEYWILMFWPVILSALTTHAVGFARSRRVAAGAIGLAGAILSHTLMGYVTVMMMILYVCLKWIRHFVTNPKKSRGKPNAETMMVAIGMGLASFFWLPALAEMRFTGVSGQIGSTAFFADHFVCPVQLWSSAWGFGGSAPGCIDGLSFMLGKVHILMGLVGLIILGLGTRTESRYLGKVGGMLAALGVFMTLSLSKPIWDSLPFFAYLQYPWRFLEIAILGLSILGGFSVASVRSERLRNGITVVVILVSLIVYVKRFQPQYIVPVSGHVLESPGDIRWRVSRISDEYLPAEIIRPKEESEANFDTIASASGLRVSTVRADETSGTFIVFSDMPRTVTVRKAYFPGWKFYVDEQQVDPTVSYGLPGIRIPAGQSVVRMNFTDTPVRTAGNMLSLVSLVGMCLMLYGRKNQTIR